MFWFLQLCHLCSSVLGKLFALLLHVFASGQTLRLSDHTPSRADVKVAFRHYTRTTTMLSFVSHHECLTCSSSWVTHPYPLYVYKLPLLYTYIHTLFQIVDVNLSAAPPCMHAHGAGLSHCVFGFRAQLGSRRPNRISSMQSHDGHRR